MKFTAITYLFFALATALAVKGSPIDASERKDASFLRYAEPPSSGVTRRSEHATGETTTLPKKEGTRVDAVFLRLEPEDEP